MFPHPQILSILLLQMFMKHRNTSLFTTRQSSRKSIPNNSCPLMVLMNGEDIILVKPDGTWHTIILSEEMEQSFKRALITSAPCTPETILSTCNLWLLFLQETFNQSTPAQDRSSAKETSQHNGKPKRSKQKSLNSLVNMEYHPRT